MILVIIAFLFVKNKRNPTLYFFSKIGKQSVENYLLCINDVTIMQNSTENQSNPIKGGGLIRLHSEVREKLHTPLTFE